MLRPPSLVFSFIMIILSFIFSACAPAGSTGGTLTPSVVEGDTFELDSTQVKEEVQPLWEVERGSATAPWTSFTYATLQQYGGSLIKGAKDIGHFCRNYSNLTDNQKLNVVTFIISAIVKEESAFDPANRLREGPLGMDRITGDTVYSEGLLQLSYQDVFQHPYCNEFNWNVDKKLKSTDTKKTILDPYKNLKCGIRILDEQVRERGIIAVDSGAYWSTLRPSKPALAKIEAATQALAICQ